LQEPKIVAIAFERQVRLSLQNNAPPGTFLSGLAFLIVDVVLPAEITTTTNTKLATMPMIVLGFLSAQCSMLRVSL